MKIDNSPNYLMVILSFTYLTGFLGLDSNNPELEVAEFIRNTQNTMQPNENLDLGPLPQVAKYQTKTFNIQAQSPFYLKDFVLDNSVEIEEDEPSNQCQSAACGDGPPIKHKPYLLEDYELTELSMVGTLVDDNGERVALIQTPNLGIVNAARGEYLGKNYGKVVTIEEDHVVVREKYKVPLGWQNRMAVLELFN